MGSPPKLETLLSGIWDFKTLLEILSTVGWKLLRWPNSQWFHQHFPHFFFNPFNHPPCVCQRLLVIPSSPVPYSSLTASSVWSVTVAGKWATVSNLFQPASPSCWPFAATAAPLATLPRSLCPSSRFFSAFFFTITFPVGGSTHRWDVACRFTRRFFGFHVTLT